MVLLKTLFAQVQRKKVVYMQCLGSKDFCSLVGICFAKQANLGTGRETFSCD